MNLQMFERIKEKILTDPENFEMNDFRCGTSFCIAGWAVALDCMDKGTVIPEDPCWNWEANAAKILGITSEYDEDYLEQIELSQAEMLFYVGDWPEVFQHNHYDDENKDSRAKNACARIDHFIATDGRE